MVKRAVQNFSRHCLRIFYKRKGGIKAYINRGGFDVPFFALLIAVLTVGIIMMFSASYVNAWYDAGTVSTGSDPYYYFKKQIMFAILGLVAMFVMSRIRTDVYEDAAIFVLIIAIILLLWALIHPVIIPGKEKFHRWIKLPLIGNFQPSELAKIAVVAYCAWSLAKRKQLVEKHWAASIPHIAVIAVICGLVYLENHFSGTILIFVLGVFMLFVGGTPMRVFGVGAAAAGVIAVLFGDKLAGYVQSRFSVWIKLLTEQELTKDELQGEAWQSVQSLYAIGSGGMFGLGFGNSRQKHLFLPEPQNDFVYAIVCEELGYIGAIIVMGLFVALVLRGFYIARHTRDRFGSLIAMGICFQVGLEAALNIAVASALAPNTGISLPFFSYGGSAMIILLLEMGVVLSVSRGMDRPEKAQAEKAQERDNTNE